MEEIRNCSRCNGTGTIHYSAVGDIPAKDRGCFYCRSTGHFEKPDFAKILKGLAGRKNKLRSVRPVNRREYFVWRMARFHGGVDVTMPVMAMLDIEGDPYKKELEDLSDFVALFYFGNNMAAAHRWGSVFGLVKKEIPNLPPTAYECGPVLLEGKPEEEMEELK